MRLARRGPECCRAARGIAFNKHGMPIRGALDIGATRPLGKVALEPGVNLRIGADRANQRDQITEGRKRIVLDQVDFEIQRTLTGVPNPAR